MSSKVRIIQIEQVGESHAPVLESVKVEYGPDLLVVFEETAPGETIKHVFPWCNVRCTREWFEGE